jgi:hypothetical protein
VPRYLARHLPVHHLFDASVHPGVRHLRLDNPPRHRHTPCAFYSKPTDDDVLEDPSLCSPHPPLRKRAANRRVLPPPWTIHPPSLVPPTADRRTDASLPCQGHRSPGRSTRPDWSDRAGSPASTAWGTCQGFLTSHRDSRQGGRESFHQPLSAKKRVRVGEACCVNERRGMSSSLVIAPGNRKKKKEKGKKKKKRADRSLLVVHRTCRASINHSSPHSARALQSRGRARRRCRRRRRTTATRRITQV